MLSVSSAPLAEKMRPIDMAQFRGQSHLLAMGMPLRQAIDGENLHSMLLWGPPGSGKTTLARLMAANSKTHFIAISAVLSGVKDIRAVIEQAQQAQQLGNRTLLFVDEVHRFNKSQQDAFLPFVEDGTLIFVGATTENPSFELNDALLSRSRLYKLRSLEDSALQQIVEYALATHNRQESETIEIREEALKLLIAAGDGDGRRVLNILDIVLSNRELNGVVTLQQIEVAAGEKSRRFDKGGDSFYEQISALHKSIRGSKPDAALYWFARMLDGGADPLYIARRVVRIASEDIGNADPRALQIALSGWDTYSRLGTPEGELAIAQAISYLAVAPKSNAIYKAWGEVQAAVKSGRSYNVPEHLRNGSPNYRYAHDEVEAYAAGENYFPSEFGEQSYYHPVERGMEIKIKERFEYLKKLDLNARSKR
ncbi:MAG: replication-associated recombination protein A [Thiotrichales bacterium]|jgi:putative ATPase|nr:replication-associated recombination protein A [Thiotrichales bacterium]MBT3613155.1 replication-associated recombination protein A [Thiotrichales bacterium]MBT3753260.1 replication-associated recombination protein A [Thiotrichales bacterium]MBT3837483.1 replication-associated recombination protein A [Thiotrichales bacterium]MBT4152599.1 replication-associated recombination protein A [Thiotrichales bacterium]